MPKITVYTTPICPYCSRAKALLKTKGAEFEEIDVFMNSDLRVEMEQKSGRRTVPQIFVGDTHVGGGADLYALNRPASYAFLDKDGGTSYLKATIPLETENPATAAELKERFPQVKDAILLLIGNKTFDDLRDLQGKMQLRAELLGRVNGLLKTGKVTHIYFTDFVVQ